MKQDLVPALLLSTCLHTKEVIKLITFLFYLFYLLPLLFIWRERHETRNRPEADSRPGVRHAVIRVEGTETCIRAVISVTAYDKCFVYRQIVLVHEFQQSSQRKSVKSRTFVGCIPKMFQKINNSEAGSSSCFTIIYVFTY